MNSRIVRRMTKATLFAAMLLSACLFGSPANAQSDFQGKFTLLYETHWGKAVLPAGNYVMTFTHNMTPNMLVIRDAASGLIVAYESLTDREDGAKGESALLISSLGRQHVVYSLRIAELSESFAYERPSARERTGEEARKKQVVRVILAKK